MTAARIAPEVSQCYSNALQHLRRQRGGSIVVQVYSAAGLHLFKHLYCKNPLITIIIQLTLSGLKKKCSIGCMRWFRLICCDKKNSKVL